MIAAGMNDPARPSLLERLSALILREPADRQSLLELLRSAYQRNLLDADALSIIEGALTVSEMQVRDIMIPRAQMDVIDIHEPVEQFIPQVIGTAHSRFPVIDQNRDDVIGVLHLRGHDHMRKADAARMEKREIRILRRLGFGDPYAVR